MSAKKLTALLLTAAIACSAAGCKNFFKAQEGNNTDINTGTDISISSPMTYENDAFYLKDGQESGLNEDVLQDGCIWTVTSIEVTKVLGNRLQTDFNYWGEPADDLGNLTGNESYVFVRLCCKNSSDSMQEVLLNSHGFVIADEAGKLMETGAEARYIRQRQDGNDSVQKQFHYILEAGEETGIVEIGYIISDDFLDYMLYYCIGSQGSALGDPENRYVKADTEK